MNSDVRRVLAEMNMSKEESLNFPYMSRESIATRTGQAQESEVPLSPEKSEWEIENNEMSRTYLINSRDHFSYFINNILDHSKNVGHDPRLIISYPQVSIQLKTHDLDEVTELDLEFSRFIEEIYEDIQFLTNEF